MMIPGQHEGRPRAAAVDLPTPLAPVGRPENSRAADIPPVPPRRRELSAGLRVAIFAATLLTVTWVMMWIEAATR
jgi:hypothetical protein